LENKQQTLAEELMPTSKKERTWNFYNYLALWIAMDIGIPTYYLASGLLVGGMNVPQAMFTILLGNLIILVPILLNGHAGAKYGIPSPVYWRSAFGFSGASVAAVIRGIVAAGWFGIQIWIGGTAIHTVLSLLFPSWANFSGGVWVGFGIFWVMNILVLLVGMKALKWLESIAAPFLVIWLVILLVWAFKSAGNSFGPLVSAPSSFATTGAFLAFFIPSLTANVAYWGPLTLNVTDFTRHAKSQKSSMLGQLVGLPSGMVGLALVGTLVTSCTVVIFGEAVWDPVALTGYVGNPFFVIGSMLFLVLATLSTNTAANALSPSIDLAYLSGGKLNYKMAVIVLGLIAIVIQPWKLLTDLSLYMNVFLVGGSTFLGPVAGICISNYFLVYKKKLNVGELYQRDGQYAYAGLARMVKPIMLVHFILAGITALLAVIGPSGWVNGICELGTSVRIALIIYAVVCAVLGLLLFLRPKGGLNPVALLTLTVSVTVPFLGLWFSSMVLLYQASWFVGIIIAVVMYYLIMKGLGFNADAVEDIPAETEEVTA